jgi:octaprenyl-diphosphate synthase
VIAEGEVLQLMNVHDPDTTVDQYLRVIRFKTAKLFEASARLGAMLSDAPPEVEEACAAYGRAMGTAFQLIDDVLDYEGDAALLGKNVGDDLREGKPTLPLLLALQMATPEQADLLRQCVLQGEVDRLSDVVQIVRDSGALQATKDAAQREADQAAASLQLLPQNPWSKALLEFAIRSVERSS